MQVLVIGAGVVGLAIARGAALAGHEVIVAEATGGIGNGVSSRNSEVIHGGMYYPTGSMRAKHCVRGRRMLYDFLISHGVPHKKVGKLIVATDAKQTAKIEGIAKQGEINGVEGLEFLGGNAARAMEPALNCVAALYSPETGIIDSHAFMLALQGDLEDRGGMIAFNTPVEGDNNAATQLSSGSSRCASAALSHSRLVTPLARAAASIFSTPGISASLVATISLPSCACGTPCSRQ